ncbi:MAG: 6,7-dimethyl-8-ribityllumazine synthase [Candidatus Taylorbacteria bacterium CG11_big_fil_rev_8_21_14_0_20_46_11]|uniref:6,7-dimethyl-8-ribityllumazine synthase n=1 Tax=Candidatus Taylorbacteria bacterium CG11_big_fil_rev_8_21_14_0_20_46_11 TaxID=1975025 RepID=A0A2H0KCI1_9BACT|nr:MAG: 6,7-dimethyl-8-ribityllumazine synthase [Candidatus Taylorbacteria bacterium CG11_big_fil_rev_8_21_14_0_20_46_11]
MKHFAIVVAEFNADITEKLLRGALNALESAGVLPENIKVVHVPGAFELPLMCQKLARTKKYDGLVALGCVIKGETDHYFYVAGEASRGIMEVMLREDIPIGFGVITVNTVMQAKARSGVKNNAGAWAAEAVLQML